VAAAPHNLIIERNLGGIEEEPVSHDGGARKRVIVRRGEIPHLNQFAESRVPAGGVIPAHRHEDMWELFLCTSGQGELAMPGARHALTPGRLVAVPPRTEHGLSSTGPEELVLLVLAVAV
jgi:quercetin dioxygenase-like cupin family protein